MKILIISTHDIYGGAARAAFRLHEALLQNNIDSQMLVAEKQSDLNSVIKISMPRKKTIGRRWDRLYNKVVLHKCDSLHRYKKTMTQNFGPFSLQAVSNKKLVKTINEINPDIVHLHWICYDFLSIEDIGKINAPIVWSLHDMWAFTGGCHCVVGDDIMCDQYTQNCGNCGFLGSQKATDLSFMVLKRKKKIFTNVRSMVITGPSNWMQDCAQKSTVFTDRKIVRLPNLIDTNVFKPMDKYQARMLWNLPNDKKLILFGAVSATTTPYKGYDLLIDALNKIFSENVEFIVFGSSEPETPPKLPHKVRYLGHLNDDVSLVSLYSASDVMIVPSKRENLSNAIMESLSCGTPVVCFDIGGNADMVSHKVNGYLAQPFDTSDLAKGIDWVLNNDNRAELSQNAREKVVREFDYGVVAKKYIDLYGELLRNG